MMKTVAICSAGNFRPFDALSVNLSDPNKALKQVKPLHKLKKIYISTRLLNHDQNIRSEHKQSTENVHYICTQVVEFHQESTKISKKPAKHSHCSNWADDILTTFCLQLGLDRNQVRPGHRRRPPLAQGDPPPQVTIISPPCT